MPILDKSEEEAEKKAMRMKKYLYDHTHKLGDDVSKIVLQAIVLFVCLFLITPPLPRDGGTARTAIQAHAVNLIEIRLVERWQPILNQSWVTGSPTTNKADCH